MLEIGSRKRNLPAPPRAVFDDLTSPFRSTVRPWLHLLNDEQIPEILEAERPHRVVWSSLWARRPDAQIVFDLPPGNGGTDLRWTLFVNEPIPDESLIGHLRKRLNTVLHADLRYTYG